MHFKVQTLSFYLNTTTIITVQKLGKCPSKYMSWVFYVFMNSGSKSMNLGNKSQLICWIKHSSSTYISRIRCNILINREPNIVPFSPEPQVICFAKDLFLITYNIYTASKVLLNFRTMPWQKERKMCHELCEEKLAFCSMT